MFNYRNAEIEEIPNGILAEALCVSNLYRLHEKLTRNIRFEWRRVLGGILARNSILAIWQGRLVLCWKAVFVSSQHLEGISLQGNYKYNEYKQEFPELKKNGLQTTCSAQQVGGKEKYTVAKAVTFLSREKMALSSHLLDHSDFNWQLIINYKSESPQKFA